MTGLGAAALAMAVCNRMDELGLRTVADLAAAMDASIHTAHKVRSGRISHVTLAILDRLDTSMGWPQGHAAALIGPEHITETTGRRGVSDKPVRTRAFNGGWTAPDPLPVITPTVDYGPPPLLSLPDPALQWRSPRTPAGRVEQVQRWTYALAVVRIITAEAGRPRVG